jgi:N-acetylglucosamine-6-sulfatase
MALALLLACGAALVSSEDPEVFAQEEEQGKPNIVYILADDARYEDLMFQEGISDLAARGALFRDYHLTNPLCCPARATYLTGQYAHSHGIIQNEHKGEQGWYWFKKKGHAADSLAVWMKEAGYQNAVFGKLMNGYTNNMRTPPGFRNACRGDLRPCA